MKRLLLAALLMAGLQMGCRSSQDNTSLQGCGQTKCMAFSVQQQPGPSMFLVEPEASTESEPFEDLKEAPDFSGFDVVAIIPPSDTSEEKHTQMTPED